MVDTQIWRDTGLGQIVEEVMVERLAYNQPRLKLYADLIYNSGPLVTARWNNRHGPVQEEMRAEYDLMSKIRMPVESPCSNHFHVSAQLTNCHNCLYGSQSMAYFNCKPPTI